MEPYTAGDGSTLPQELFSDDWETRKTAARRQEDLATLRAVLDHDPDWIVRASAFRGIDYAKNALWGTWLANRTCSHDVAMMRLEPYDELIERSALRDPSWRIRLLATLRSYYADDETLVAIAINDESEIVRRAAADIIRERLRYERKFQPKVERPIFAAEEFLPAEVKRYRFFVDDEGIQFRSPDGEEAFSFYPEFEACRDSDITGSDWLDLREAILEAKDDERKLLLEDVPTWGRGFCHYYFHIKPVGKGMTELRFLECPSGCDMRGSCPWKEWEANPGALFDYCIRCLQKFRLVLPYADLSAAARDAVVRNERALLLLEAEHVSRWEEEEVDAGIRE